MLEYKRAIVGFLLAARAENWEKHEFELMDICNQMRDMSIMRELDQLFPASGLAAAIDDCVGQVNPHQYNISGDLGEREVRDSGVSVTLEPPSPLPAEVSDTVRELRRLG